MYPLAEMVTVADRSGYTLREQKKDTAGDVVCLIVPLTQDHRTWGALFAARRALTEGPSTFREALGTVHRRSPSWEHQRPGAWSHVLTLHGKRDQF